MGLHPGTSASGATSHDNRPQAQERQPRRSCGVDALNAGYFGVAVFGRDERAVPWHGHLGRASHAHLGRAPHGQDARGTHGRDARATIEEARRLRLPAFKISTLFLLAGAGVRPQAYPGERSRVKCTRPMALSKRRRLEPEGLQFASPGRSPGKERGKHGSPVRAIEGLWRPYRAEYGTRRLPRASPWASEHGPFGARSGPFSALALQGRAT